MTKQAEIDEFRILKAQIDKRYGRQPRLSKRQMRKRSDEDIEKYNQLAVADEQEMESDYQTAWRGRVQNRRVALDYMPMYVLSTERQQSVVKHYVAFDRHVDSLNRTLPADRQLYIVCTTTTLSEAATQRYFSRIGQLSNLLERAVALSVIQNYADAIDDLTTYLQTDSTSSLAYWQRAVCQSRLNHFNASQGTDVRMKTANVLIDLNRAIELDANAYLYYNRGNVRVERQDFSGAISDYSKAIELDANLAEAWYNRGLARIAAKHTQEGIDDLSKAGELGLYTAYSIIKKYRQ
jgi:tetratricopeptide (TPR) repeat protein